jgi:predicted amidophosphoribosyltransferase
VGLKSCSECGKEVSDSAQKCPHCGAYNPTNSFFYSCGGILLGFFLLCLLAVVCTVCL